MFKEKISSLPLAPGCYLMKNRDNEVIYVGKAKKLKNRVSSYFTGVHNGKTQKMVSQVADFDIIVTSSEKEALLLEINLIKEHRPRFNIMFMDDKSYPYIKISNEPYPRLQVVRDRKKDKKAKYFGPYPDAKAARDTMALLNDLYPIRKCKTMPKKVCLYYHIHQCVGPCQFKIDEDVYEGMMNEIVSFLSGDNKAQIRKLEQQLKEAVSLLEFEKAADIRDKMKAIEHISEHVFVQASGRSNQDVFGIASKHGVVAIVGFMVREGKLIEKTTYMKSTIEEDADALSSYLIQYYQSQPKPKEVLLPEIIDAPLISEVLSVKAIVPQRGDKLKLVAMASENAATMLDVKFDSLMKREDFEVRALSSLKELLHVDSVDRIELFDNSHTSGSFTVAGMVVFEDGKPKRSDYRKYRLHQENNDVESMKEVLYRRLVRGLKEKSRMPDVIVVDGGALQVSAALEIRQMLHLTMPVVGLVKDSKHQTRGIVLESLEIIEGIADDPLMLLFASMQDEVHRFAISYHRQLRSKAMTRSLLDEVEGIGPKRKKELLAHFGSLRAIKEADVDALSEVLPRAVAQNLKEFLERMKEEL